MKRHLANAAYGVLDYASYPVGMFIAAPIVLHKLGAAEYGLWTIATAVISTGGVIASGFCDANIQRVAQLRGSGDHRSMAGAVRSILGVNLIFSLVLCLFIWCVAPFAAQRIAVDHPMLLPESLIALRIGALLIVVRAVESAFISTQRAFEHFRSFARINAAVRLLTLASAAALAFMGRNIVSILLATAAFLVIGTACQYLAARRLLGNPSLIPWFESSETRVLLRQGIFSWIQALGSVIFGQLDRVVLGVALGAAVVAPYSLCVQFAQPIANVTGSGLQFLLPYFSAQLSSPSARGFSRTLLKAFLGNLLLVTCGAGVMLLTGRRLIAAWAGPAVAAAASSILTPIVIGSALAGLGVTAGCALLALGQFRTAAILNLFARAVMLLVMLGFAHRGLQGLATARLCHGVLSLLIYLPLLRHLSLTRRSTRAASPLASELQGVFEP